MSLHLQCFGVEKKQDLMENVFWEIPLYIEPLLLLDPLVGDSRICGFPKFTQRGSISDYLADYSTSLQYKKSLLKICRGRCNKNFGGKNSPALCLITHNGRLTPKKQKKSRSCSKRNKKQQQVLPKTKGVRGGSADTAGAKTRYNQSG